MGYSVKTTNALGRSETKTFDTKTGNVLTLTGPNGLTRDNLASIKPCVLFFNFTVKSIKVGDFRRGATCCCGHLVDNPCVALVAPLSPLTKAKLPPVLLATMD
jgi:hypothetical protein